jgi:precorrin-6A synthase
VHDRTVRTLFVIGIGAGNPEHLTLQGVAAIQRVDVFFVIDKGNAPELRELRDGLIGRHATAKPHRIVEIPEVERDRTPEDYESEVADWHRARAVRIGGAIRDELDEDGVGAFLVLGDPSLYDSTLRLLARVREARLVDFDVEVVPGITSVQALAASHGVPLHGVGEPVLITTGRRLAGRADPPVPNTVVMLDGLEAFTGVDDPDAEILWGAYLGMADEILVAGPLDEVAEEIVERRAAARAERGWILDTYLVRRTVADDEAWREG